MRRPTAWLPILTAVAVAACTPSDLRAPRVTLPAEGVECPAGIATDSTNFDPRPPTGGRDYDIPVPRGLTRSYVVHAGDLALPSGTIVTGSGGEVAFPLGRRPVDLGAAGDDYPVNLLVARFDNGAEAVAFAELVARPSPIVRWRGSDALSFTTDGGDGAYLSMEAEDYAATGDGQWMFDAIDRAAAEDEYPLCDHVVFTGRPPLDVIVFRTGWGDGAYPTAVGYDAEGRPSALVTYMFVLPWRLAGLPGAPPAQVLAQEARRTS